MLHTSDVTVRNQVRTVVGAAEEWTYATVDGGYLPSYYSTTDPALLYRNYSCASFTCCALVTIHYSMY